MRSKLVLILAATAALSAGAASAQEAAAGSGVTFLNETQRTVNLTAKPVAGDDCLASGELQKVGIEAGQESTVAASSNVCYCLGTVRRNSCTTSWTMAKAGAKVRLR